MREIDRLMVLHNGLCHYCDEPCNRRSGSAKEATREHVVPRFFGGRNRISNYVLACHSCNNKRGSLLWYCKCIHCVLLIEQALGDQYCFDKVFKGIINFNKPRVSRDENINCPQIPWVVRRGTSRKRFATHAEAIEHAITYNPVKERQANG